MLAAGMKIGKSLAEPDLVGEAQAIVDDPARKGGDVPIPTDVVCAKEIVRDGKAEIKPVAARCAPTT